MRQLLSSHRPIAGAAAFAAVMASFLFATPAAQADWHRGGGGWHGGAGWHRGGWGWRGGHWGCCWRGGVFIGVPPVYVSPPVYYPPPPVYYAPPPVYYPPYAYAPGY